VRIRGSSESNKKIKLKIRASINALCDRMVRNFQLVRISEVMAVSFVTRRRKETLAQRFSRFTAGPICMFLAFYGVYNKLYAMFRFPFFFGTDTVRAEYTSVVFFFCRHSRKQLILGWLIFYVIMAKGGEHV
jgi:hypothetical protein